MRLINCNWMYEEMAKLKFNVRKCTSALMKFQGHVSICSETEIVVEHIQRELIGHQGLIADLGVRHRIRRNFYVPSETNS